MKAYGLAVLFRNSLGVRTEVLTEDESETDYLRIISSLTATQLNQLQTLADMNGWEIAYHCWYSGKDSMFPGTEAFLTVVPKGGEVCQ
jgi:hypothetical protein